MELLAGVERMPNRLETWQPIPESIRGLCITARYCNFPEESTLALNSRLLLFSISLCHNCSLFFLQFSDQLTGD